MSVSILICTHGDRAWSELAWSRAYPSAMSQGALEVLVEHDDALSLAAIRNQAAALADGDWLCFLDADDELAPGYVAAMHQHAFPDALEEPPRLLLAPALQMVRAGAESPAVIPNKGGWPRVNEAVIGTLIPRALFLELGGFRERSDDGTALSLYEDWDCFLRAWDAGARIVHVPAAVYRQHVGAGSRNQRAEWREVYAAIWADHEARAGALA